uniref:Uncharacterized protein n=1 Tax=Arundo donax TaxID=35708 RepID=A0A0A9G7N6_ARUDO
MHLSIGSKANVTLAGHGAVARAVAATAVSRAPPHAAAPPLRSSSLAQLPSPLLIVAARARRSAAPLCVAVAVAPSSATLVAVAHARCPAAPRATASGSAVERRP